MKVSGNLFVVYQYLGKRGLLGPPVILSYVLEHGF